MRLHSEIVSFKQRPDKNLYHAWEWFKDLLQDFPHQQQSNESIPKYAKYLRDNKVKLQDVGAITLTEVCSAVMTQKIPKKLRDQEGKPRPTTVVLQLADGSFTHPDGITEDVFIKVPIILGRPCLKTGGALIDVREGILKMRVEDEEMVFDIYKNPTIDGDKCGVLKPLKTSSDYRIEQPKMKPLLPNMMKVEVDKDLDLHQKEMSVFSIVDVYYEDDKVSIEEKFGMETLTTVLMKFDSEGIEEYEEMICALTGMGSYSYSPKKLDLDLKNHPTPPAKPSIKDPPVLELKELLGYLWYVFLGSGNTLPVIIEENLDEQQVESLISA
ncbi:uncharacterized protein LOC124899497 [Capsicum annuum]|uniref:uncharacterized protein LOC124899497 n=1 Tax=Capsicum annuum TaxID=4072 RepID=UPI001FB08D5B|nr:uncharacterized protein LOC124899497 [Capsicum annuum]